MKKLNLNITSSYEAELFIQKCENDFFDELDEAVERIVNAQDLKVITLSGPTCSGKTTTAARLINKINANGHKAVVISIDDFFLDRQYRNRTDLEAPDYDSVKALDLDYFSYFAERLMNGKSVLVPQYNFTATRRVGYNEYIPQDEDIYVIEGIQAVYPEIVSVFPKQKSIFICVNEDMEYNGTIINMHDIRLLRRIVRDYNFRGATPEFSMHLWQGVRENEERNIFPNSKSCDIYIDSCLQYELFILKYHAIPLLESIPQNSVYYINAETLINKLKAFDIPYFKDCMIPKNSVFREFIG